MRKSALFIFAGLWLAVLTGCGQEEVIYGEDTGSKEQEEVQENQASETLRDLLGVGDEKIWEETIEGEAGPIKLYAEINVPDTARLYTMTATKNYLDQEDKKRIAEHFLDTDTIKVNRDATRTKESIKEQISEIESWFEEPLKEEDIAYYKQEIEELNEEMVSAPDYDDIEEEPGDYSGNYYIGNKEDARYSIWFFEDSYTDAPDNICSWSVYREERLNAEGQTEDSDTDKMTEEKASLQAEKICKELGLSNVSVVSVTSPDVYTEDGTEHINYYVDLARNINGVAVDSNIYYTDKSYEESKVTVPPYPQEYISIVFDEFGLVGVNYAGSINIGEVGDAVKLLSYNQIQEILRRELEAVKTDDNYAWTLLELSYLRVADESEPDVFCFLPVWRLGKKNDSASDNTDYNIFLNAIDGSRIYPEEVGVAQFFGDMGV